jgi:hypothetical protein
MAILEKRLGELERVLPEPAPHIDLAAAAYTAMPAEPFEAPCENISLREAARHYQATLDEGRPRR